MDKNGYMKKGKFTDPMIIGGGLFLPVQEKGTRLPYVESKPIWRLVYDEKQKKKHNNCAELEAEAMAEGNESLAAVWRARKKKAEAYRDLIARREA